MSYFIDCKDFLESKQPLNAQLEAHCNVLVLDFFLRPVILPSEVLELSVRGHVCVVVDPLGTHCFETSQVPF